MARLVALVATIVICISTVTVLLGVSADQSCAVHYSRSEVTTGIPVSPSNPPTPASNVGRYQFLWEDFESATFPPPDWDTLNLNPGYGWFLGTFTGGGTQSALVTWDQSPPVTLQDEWLITPELDVSGALSQLRVEFYMLQGYNYPHDFKVHVTDDDGANWTEVFDSYGTGYPAHQWYFVSVPLSSWVGNAAPIRIGFQYYGTDADLFGIDNVEVTDDEMATGRCCVYVDPLNPDCYDDLTQPECGALSGIWTEGLDCTTNPCPLQGLQLEPSDDLYTDPDGGAGHPHPVEQSSLWTSDSDFSGHHQRIMMKWDLSALADTIVDSAFVNIYRYFRCPNDYYTNCDLYHITEDWDEDTWNDYVHISHSVSSFMSYNFGPALGWYRLDISDVVNQWLVGSLSNYGIVIQARYGQKWSKFYSKDGLYYPPYLELYGLSGTNQCPILDSIGNHTIHTDVEFALTISASDSDQTIPDLFCVDLPPTATFTDNHDGTADFQWLPTSDQLGDHTVLFYADDGTAADSEYVTLSVFVCGDCDASGVVEISDAVFLVNYIFVPGSPAPDPYESGDADCSGVVEISDAVYIINYIFVPGSPEPCDPDGDGEPDC